MKDKRHTILDAALALFSADGYGAVAVPRIARAAGVAVGTLYLYFPAKADLANALFQREKGRFNARVLAPIDPALSAERQFAVYWGRLMAWIEDEPLAAWFLDDGRHEGYLDDKSRAAARVHEVGLRGFMRSGLKTGVFRPADPQTCAILVWGAYLGALTHARREGTSSLATLADGIGAGLWRALSGRDA